MTCIVGGKCIDGVVLVADRRVIYPNDSLESRDKIFMDFHPFVIASSGSTSSFDNFRREAKELANKLSGYYDEKGQRFTTFPVDPSVTSGVATLYHTSKESPQYPVIRLYKYLEELKIIVQKYKKESFFDVLVASRTLDNMDTHLEYIGENGMTDIGNDRGYTVIGSNETHVAAEFLMKSLWKKSLKMDAFTEMAYFIIKYVDRFKTDIKVGLEGEKPLVWLIPNEGEIDKATDNYLKKLENNTDQMLDTLVKHGLKPLMNYSSPRL